MGGGPAGTHQVRERRGGSGLHLAAMAMIAAFAALLAYGAALPHPGVSVDSGEYLAVAEGLSEGHGLTMPYVNYDEPWQVVGPNERVPMAQFPPLYPSVVAGVHVTTGLSLTDSARLIGTVVFFFVVLAVEVLLWRRTGSILWAAAAGALLVAPDLVTVHAMAWSEPLLLAGMVGLVAFITRHLETGRTSYLMAAACSGAAASLVRFAGIALVMGAGLLVATASDNRRRRLLTGMLFAAAALSGVAAWFVRNALVVGTASEKTPGLYPPNLDDLEQFLETIGGWFVPGDPVALICGALVIGALLWMSRSKLPSLLRSGDALIRTCTVIGLAYFAFVLSSKLLLDRNIPLDPRLLAPLQVLAVIAVCAFLGRRKGIRPPIAAMLCALVALTVFRASYTAWEFSSLNVASYTNRHWRKSPTLRYAGELPPDTLVISNATDPLWLWHDRTALLVPSRVNLYSGRRNTSYRKQVAELHAATRCRDAVVVFFSKPTRKPPREIDPEVRRQLGLVETEDFRDGEIYDVDEPPADCT